MMSKILVDRKVLEQALEALEGFVRFAAIHSDGPDASDKYLAEDYAEEAFLKTAKVLPDLRAALEQQEQGAVALERERAVELTQAYQEGYERGSRNAQQEQEQEPVAWIHRQGNHWDVSERILTDDEKARGWTEEPLFAHPPRREPLTVTELQQALVDADLVDPDAIDDPDRYDAGSTVAQIDALHSRLMQTTPPRREWVNLTEEEIDALFLPSGSVIPFYRAMARVVEQALKERNT
jgi:hypothetical protein